MKVLMLGWEFPPFISGGLGTACYGLTRALSGMGTEILFVLPRPVSGAHTEHVRILQDESDTPVDTEELLTGPFANVRFFAVDAAVDPYARPEAGRKVQADTSQQVGKTTAKKRQSPAATESHYGGDLFAEVRRYAQLVCRLARREDFDVIHAHDWITYPAGVEVAHRTGKPLIVHVHSTEFDRSGLYVNQRIYDIERAGMKRADAILTVSRFTRDIVVQRYGVPGRKVSVVHNGILLNGTSPVPAWLGNQTGERTVLFMGRITRQKGPEYFLAAARRVLEKMDGVRFVMAGSGDRLRGSIDLAAQMGISGRVVFTGFLRGDDVERAYRMADLYVMPSVSEPFGLTPLEAISHGVPVIISRQSGVAEVLPHAPKVDFWDVEDLADKIVTLLQQPSLRLQLCDQGREELRRLSWDNAARRCRDVYQTLAHR